MRTVADLSCTSDLYGEDEFDRSQVDQWLELSWFELEVPYSVFKISKNNSAVLATSKKAILQALAVLNHALKSRTFIVGNRITIADIALACASHETLGCPSILSGKDLAGFPHAMRWYMTITRHPAFEIRKKTPEPSSTNTLTVNAKIDDSYTKDSHIGTTSHVQLKDPKFRRRRMRVKELLHEGKAAAGKTVVVRGWLKTSRSAAKNSLLFLVLNDGSCHLSLQVVASVDTTDGFAAAASCGGVGACLAVEGTVIESPAKGQAIELQASRIEVLGPVFQHDGSIGANDYPLAKKAHSLEFLRQHAHLRARTMVYSAVMRVRNAMAFATHKFFNERGFVYVHTPLLTGADCEGAGEQFVVTTLLPAEHEGKNVELPRLADGTVDYSKVI